jgi:transcriptional regulator with XRE-family HTH domain
MAGHSVLAKRLKEARLRAGMSQKALGIRAGIDEFSASPRVNQYEQGKHLPDLLTAERLAKVLQVPTPYLYAKDDGLASWILAHDIVDASTRRAVLRKIMKRVPR